MLMQSFERVAIAAKKQEIKVRSAMDFLSQAQSELKRAQELHNEEVLGLLATAEANKGQLDAYHEDNQRIRLEAQLAYAQANTSRAENEELQEQIQALTGAVELSKVQAEQAEASLAARQQTEDE